MDHDKANREEGRLAAIETAIRWLLVAECRRDRDFAKEARMRLDASFAVAPQLGEPLEAILGHAHEYLVSLLDHAERTLDHERS